VLHNFEEGSAEAAKYYRLSSKKKKKLKLVWEGRHPESTQHNCCILNVVLKAPHNQSRRRRDDSGVPSLQDSAKPQNQARLSAEGVSLQQQLVPMLALCS
jgi:hypothetical protein